MDSEMETQEGGKLDSEMETKDTDRYENITVCISKAILDQVRHEALAIGVSVYDMIRFTLGERFKSYGMRIDSSPLPLFPQPVTPDWTTLFREFMAMSGQLKCDNCDSKLKLSDVRNNTCSKCFVAIDPMKEAT